MVRRAVIECMVQLSEVIELKMDYDQVSSNLIGKRKRVGGTIEVEYDGILWRL